MRDSREQMGTLVLTVAVLGWLQCRRHRLWWKQVSEVVCLKMRSHFVRNPIFLSVYLRQKSIRYTA